MAKTEYVEVYNAESGEAVRVIAGDLRQVAVRDLGMVDGPFELNIFTKTILATALQREQIERNAQLQKVMTENGDWKTAMRAVSAVSEIMEKLGIEDAKWSPTTGGTVVGISAPAKPARPTTGAQVGLNLDGQLSIDEAEA